MPAEKIVRPNISCGKQGEQIAQAYLEKQGFRIVDVNVRMGKKRGLLGELDIVAWEGDALCFVEVKTRRGTPGFVAPAEAVTPAKQKQIARLAVAYANENGLMHEAAGDGEMNFCLRFDVVSIVLAHGAGEFIPRRIELIRGAFFASPDFADD